MVWCKA